nr:IS66 family transposase [Burkholderia cepacia]
MSAPPTDLPDDIDALKAMVANLREQLSLRAIKIEHLKLTIAKLRRMQFGRKSERVEREIEQLELRLEDLQADEGVAGVAQSKPVRKRAEATGRKPLPEHLEREEREYRPEHEACPDCGGALKAFGEDVSEQLEFVRSHFRVIRHRRPKLACACCDCIVQAAAPSRPIDCGLPGPALLAHIAISTFADHVPLYRQSMIYAREGVELDQGTMACWMGSISALLSPLVDALRRYVLSGVKVHGDDPPLPVLAPGNGQSKTGRLWVYVRDDRPAGSTESPAVWFAYTPDRRGEHPQRHLADFRGVLQADAFAGYAEFYKSGRIQEAACMAHARRKLHDRHVVRKSPITTEALERIGALYQIEAQIRGKPPDERRRIRQTHAVPLLDSVKQWFDATLLTLSGKSDTSKAIQYALNRWAALVYYCSDGRVEIDNLPAELPWNVVPLLPAIARTTPVH